MKYAVVFGSVDVGIMRQKKSSSRTPRLQRDGHIIFCICAMDQVEDEWKVADWAQVFSNVINIGNNYNQIQTNK